MLLVACSEPPAKKNAPYDLGADFWEQDPTEPAPPLEPDLVNANSGAFGAGERPSNSSSGSSSRRDAGTNTPTDGGTPPKTYCGSTLAAGDLGIDEIMISSQAGAGDYGEWVEITNRRDCWLKVQGVSVESPRATAAPNVATITDDFELAPHGTFIVAGSADSAKNHGLPGKVIAWEASDVLKNDGDTLTVRIGNIQIDTVTYPAFNNLTPGRALSFPVDCAWSDRSNWKRWSLTFDEFSTGFKGTPNADNADVTCF